MNEQNKSIHCRVCLRYDVKNPNKCLSLFESYNGRSISEKVNLIAKVVIKEGDGLPDKICPECLLQLETAVSFKQKCEASDTILRSNVLLPQKSTQQTSGPEIAKNLWVKEELIEVEVSLDLDENCIDHSDSEVPAQHIENTTEVSTETIEEDVTNITKKSRAVDLKLICDDCGCSFKSKCKLGVHWKKVHQPEKLICPNCKRIFKSYKSFNLHIKTSSRNCKAATKVRIEGQGKSRIFHCKECSYKTIRIKDIDTHLSIHTGDRRFQCKDCSKTFTQHASLHSHRETTHKEYRIDTTCHLCGKHLQGRTKYYKHMQTHTETGVTCKVCNKKLKNKKYLTMHMLRHSGVKSYSCEVCAASFFTYCELYNHRKKVHMKSRSIECDQCEYKMCSMAALKKHKAKHTGTNVICLVCGQFSEDAEKLAIHQKRHFERDVECPQCDKTYHNKRSLSKHMSKSHRCTMLVEKRESVKMDYTSTAIKQESPHKKDEIVILLSPPTILLK